MQTAALSRQPLHGMVEGEPLGPNTHRPGSPAEARRRCAAKHLEDLVVGVVAVAVLGVELARRTEAPPATRESLA